MTFAKYPKIRQLGNKENEMIFVIDDDEIIIEEKIDGANFRFMAKDGRIIFGSRTQNLGDDQQEIGGNWKRCVEFIKRQIITSKVILPEGYIFHGENCVKHSMEYDWDKIPPYLGFDIMKIGDGQFLDYDKKKELFEEVGLTLVPLIKRCKAKDMTEMKDASVPQSKYYPGQAEGIVIKNYDKGIFAKIVTEKFREVNKKAFGETRKFADNDDSRLVATYCTNPRIDKCIFKLIDDGKELDMTLMQYLPKMVLMDIYEEHAQDICWSNWSINFRKVRKKIGPRCAAVLKQVMVNNSLQKEKK